MNRILVPALMLCLLLAACKKNEVQNRASTSSSEENLVENKTLNPVDSVSAATMGDTTATSVDWNGTYKGTLPCASCPGIETTLVLNPDKTYTLEENYLEEKNGKFISGGTFSFDSSGSFISLKSEKEPTESRVFFVGEGNAWMASKVGDRSAKKEYQLIKQ